MTNWGNGNNNTESTPWPTSINANNASKEDDKNDGERHWSADLWKALRKTDDDLLQSWLNKHGHKDLKEEIGEDAMTKKHAFHECYEQHNFLDGAKLLIEYIDLEPDDIANIAQRQQWTVLRAILDQDVDIDYVFEIGLATALTLTQTPTHKQPVDIDWSFFKEQAGSVTYDLSYRTSRGDRDLHAPKRTLLFWVLDKAPEDFVKCLLANTPRDNIAMTEPVRAWLQRIAPATLASYIEIAPGDALIFDKLSNQAALWEHLVANQKGKLLKDIVNTHGVSPEPSIYGHHRKAIINLIAQVSDKERPAVQKEIDAITSMSNL